MGLVWNPWAAPSLVSGLIMAGAALFVLTVGPGRPTNRLLASVYALYALGMGSVFVQYSMDTAADVQAMQIVVLILLSGPPLLYPSFLGHALRRGAPAFFRTRAWLTGSLLALLVLGVSLVARPDLVVAAVTPVSYAPFDVEPGTLFVAWLLMTSAVALLALALSIREVVLTPPGSTARRRAYFFLAAFSLQDGLIAAQSVVLATAPLTSTLTMVTNVAGYNLAITATALLASYGIVRYQLFDIDTKIKLGVRRTTLAAIFVAIFFVISQLVEMVAGSVLGTFAGAVAAGLLLFALAPLQRMAERIASAAMPRVEDSAEYLTVRKREVYRAAVESALEDGLVTDKERGVLATLAVQLGLDAREAYDVEQEARKLARGE